MPFWFADLEGNTRTRKRQAKSAMREAVSRHDELLTAADLAVGPQPHRSQRLNPHASHPR